MANNYHFDSGAGPPFRPHMVGSIGLPQNIHPPMPQFASHASQQYQPGSGIAAMDVGVPPPVTHQMQLSQSIQQATARHLPPLSQSMTLPNIQFNSPFSSGFPHYAQSLQGSSSFIPASAGPGMPPPPAYNVNTYPSSQFQPVSQMVIQCNPLCGQPSAAISSISAVDSEHNPVEQSSSDWLEHINNGRRFYYNKKTGQSTWEKPVELMTPLERDEATTDWKEYTSSDGRKYFYNKVTKQSKWTIPEDLKLAREQADRASHVTQVAAKAYGLSAASVSDVKVSSDAQIKYSDNVVNPSPISVTPGLAPLPLKDPGVQSNSLKVESPAKSPSVVAVGPIITGNADSHTLPADTSALPMKNSDAPSVKEPVESLQNVTTKGAKETDKSTDTDGDTNVTASREKAIPHETLTYTTKQDAQDAFKEVLESANIGLDMTWEQTMRLIINDKRYAALKSLGERKQAFNEYLSQKRKQEAEERRAKHKKSREDFRKMLEECSKLTSKTRWSKAINMLSDDDRFKSIERARDRQDMFEEYMDELEKKERAKAEEERQQVTREYREFLESCDFITASSQWRKIKDRLEADQRCSRLEAIDRLKIFQEYVGELEREEDEKRRKQKEEIRRAERRNRDEFRKIMEEHVADGSLTAKTRWREYHSKIIDVPFYVAVSSNSSGSTPQELFEDVVEELKNQYQKDKRLVKDAVKSEKFDLSSTWTLEEFKTAIANKISSLKVSEINLKLVFDEMLERAREKEEKEAKRRKRLGDEFFNMLCSFKDITFDSKWEDWLPLFEGREEFRSIGEDAFSKQIFEEFLEQLKDEDEEQGSEEREAKEEKEKQSDRGSKGRKEKHMEHHDRDRGKEHTEMDEVDSEPDFSALSNENIQSRKNKDKKHHRRHQEEGSGLSLDKNAKDRSRSSRRHKSERKRSKEINQSADIPVSDNESARKKHKREEYDGSHVKGDGEDLE